MPVKFDKRVGVNIAGIDYRINSIWIEFLREIPVWSSLHITKISKIVFLLHIASKYPYVTKN